jgi:hypothetical protein
MASGGKHQRLLVLFEEEYVKSEKAQGNHIESILAQVIIAIDYLRARS